MFETVFERLGNETDMSAPLRDCLLRQLDTGWSLACYHLDGLTPDECLWRPVERGPQVRMLDNGSWAADWPIDEDYAAGPPNIAWIGWHMLYWWSMALDHAFGTGRLEREAVRWPGNADDFRADLFRLHDAWRGRLQVLTEDELLSSERVRWPFRRRSLADLFAWANVELTKNAAEIGYVRFLYGAS